VTEAVFHAIRPPPVLSLEAQLQATVEQCFRRAEAYLHHPFDRPRVLLNLRGMTAALADCTRNVLRFNRALYEHNTPDFLRVTVPHEVSHLIAYRLHGRHIPPHGAEWARIMGEIFGLEPQRCHDYDIRPSLAPAHHAPSSQRTPRSALLLPPLPATAGVLTPRGSGTR